MAVLAGKLGTRKKIGARAIPLCVCVSVPQLLWGGSHTGLFTEKTGGGSRASLDPPQVINKRVTSPPATV